GGAGARASATERVSPAVLLRLHRLHRGGAALPHRHRGRRPRGVRDGLAVRHGARLAGLVGPRHEEPDPGREGGHSLEEPGAAPESLSGQVRSTATITRRPSPRSRRRPSSGVGAAGRWSTRSCVNVGITWPSRQCVPYGSSPLATARMPSRTIPRSTVAPRSVAASCSSAWTATGRWLDWASKSAGWRWRSAYGRSPD